MAKNPLAAVHATRAPDSPASEPNHPDDTDPDALYLAVVQGLAANPASAAMSPVDFASRADELTAALGIPASVLEPGQSSPTISENEQRQRHVLTLLGMMRTHPQHDPGVCEVCDARAFLEGLQ